MKTLLLLLASWPAFGATTYYIAANGADTNNGTSKSTPWAHLPGMPTCANTCAATTPVAGDQFIFKGGDTWGYANLGVAWSWSGTSGSRIYIGVDATWYTGAAWSRPIWTCNGQACASAPGSVHTQIQIWGSYVTVDNIEFTGLYLTAAAGYGISSVQLGQPGVELKNSYFHGWTRESGSGWTACSPDTPTTGTYHQQCLTAASQTLVCQNALGCTTAGDWNGGGDITAISTYLGGGASQVLGTSIHDNVIDGYDSYLAGSRSGMGIFSGASIYNNVVRYVYNGINGDWDVLHDNLVEHVDFHASSGNHCNGFYHKAHVDDTAKTLRMYNNVLRNNVAVGCVAWYVLGDDICPTCTTYFYNNVVFDFPSAGDPPISFPGDPTSDGGTGYFYNNTIQSATAHCIGNGLNSVTGTLHYANMHCINSNGSSGSICTTGGASLTCTDDSAGHSRLETLASANAAGYCEPGVGGCTATYPYFPASGSAPTVGLGSNYTAQVSSFGSAFGSDASLAVSYDATNHVVVVPGRTALARSSSAAWDAGAYLYAATPVPPTITSTSPLTSGTVGAAYSYQFQASGDTPITWSATGVPSGLSLSSAGLLSGTPSAAATSTLSVTATNAAGSAGPTGFSLTIGSAPRSRISSATLAGATIRQHPHPSSWPAASAAGLFCV